MVYNRVRPIASSNVNNADNIQQNSSVVVSNVGIGDESIHSSSVKDFNDLDSISTVNLEESSYLKLRPFSRLDPTLVRLINFFKCFGILINLNTRAYEQPDDGRVRAASFERRPSIKWPSSKSGASGSGVGSGSSKYSRYMRVLLTLLVTAITGEVVYDVNLRQSKLLAEQKRSTPLLTFVIVAYSWLTLVIPAICDISLIMIGPHLFRFYSRTTSTVCNGMFFGKKTSVDGFVYYMLLVFVAFLDVIGQVVLLGVWPKRIDPYMRMILFQDTRSITIMTNEDSALDSAQSLPSASTMASNTLAANYNLVAGSGSNSTSSVYELANTSSGTATNSRITTYFLDFLLGEAYAHSDVGICIKIVCLMIQFMHSYAFLIIIVSLANHYASAINSINDNLDKYEFRRLLKQLIILRDSSEQISLMISIPFSLIIMLVFMRQIALNGVFIQSTMQPFENWAVSLQSFTCSVSIFMVFIYCDGLQSASKQTHRLKTEQTVINENRGGNQSIYEFLDYLDRLSKSIRITFFNIIAINKSSLVALYGHILTLTFVTS